jgi:multiple sugar transport system substrate-binding protein
VKRKGYFLVLVLALMIMSTGNMILASESWDSEPMTLTVLTATILEPGTRQVETEIAEEFMKLHPNIKVQIDGVPSGEQHKKVVVLGTVNQLPDVIQDHDTYIPANAQAGFFADLGKFADKEFFDQYLPGSLELCSYEGKVYALQIAMVNSGLLYRKDLFEEAGISPPETWDDFVDACKKLTRDTDGDGKIDQWGLAITGAANRGCYAGFSDLAYGLGWEVLKCKGDSWESMIDSPQNVQALKLFTELYHTHKVTPPGTMENTYMESVRALALGQVAMMSTGSHSIGNAAAINPEVRDKLASAPHPKGVKRTSVPFAVAWSVNANISEKKQRAAFEFIKFLTSEENQIKWSKATDWIPTMKTALDAPHLSDPVFEGFVNATECLYVPPKPSFQAKIDEYGIVAVQKALLQQEPYEKIIETFDKQVKSAIKEAEAIGSN